MLLSKQSYAESLNSAIYESIGDVEEKESSGVLCESVLGMYFGVCGCQHEIHR